MGWRTFSVLLAFWIAVFAFPMAMIAVVGAAIAVLLALALRDQVIAFAARWRQHETQPAPQSHDE